MPAWEVIYRAVADFSDLTRESAKALAELQALKKAAGDVNNAQLQGGQQIIAQRQADTKALQDQRAAMEQGIPVAQRYNQIANWRGASSETQYLANLQREEQLQRLLNIQRQRGFLTPQQDYAYRNQELTQRYLLNRAEQAGYATPEQYLSYLSTLRHAMEAENQAWRDRVAALSSATQAQLAHANALSGSHESAAQLLAGTRNAQEALTNLGSQQVTPGVSLQDQQFQADLASDIAALTDFGNMVASPGVLLDDDMFRESVLIDRQMLSDLSQATASARAELDDSDFMTTFAAIEAMLARLRGEQAKVATSTARPYVTYEQIRPQTGGANAGAGPPQALSTQLIADDAGYRASLGVDARLADDIARPRTGIFSADIGPFIAGVAAARAAAATISSPVIATVIPGSTAPAASSRPFGFTSSAQQAAADAAAMKAAAAEARAAERDLAAAAQATALAVERQDIALMKASMSAASVAEEAAKLAAAERLANDAISRNDALYASGDITKLSLAESLAETSAYRLAQAFQQARAGIDGSAESTARAVTAADELSGAMDRLHGIQVSEAAALADAEAHWGALGLVMGDVGHEADTADSRLTGLEGTLADVARVFSEATVAAESYWSNLGLAASKTDLLADAERRATATELAAAAARKAITDATKAGGGGSGGGGGGGSVNIPFVWGAIPNPHIPLFGGAFGNTAIIGGISAISLAIHALIDFVIVLIPALVAAAAGLGAFAAAASDAAVSVYNHFTQLHTVGDALQTTIAPLTGNLERMHDVVRPQVFELLGAALGSAGHQTALFNELAVHTGAILDTWAIKIEDFSKRDTLKNLITVGSYDLSQFAIIGKSIGSVFSELLAAGEKTHVAEDLLTGVAAAFHLVAVAAGAVPQPVIVAGIAFFSILHYGGALVTLFQSMALGVLNLTSRIPGLSGASMTMATALNASNVQLETMASREKGVLAVSDAMGIATPAVSKFAVSLRDVEAAAVAVPSVLTGIGNETITGAAALERYGGSLNNAGREAVALGIAAGAAGGELEKISAKFGGVATAADKAVGAAGASTGKLSGAVSNVGGMLFNIGSKYWPLFAAAGAVALGIVIDKLVTARTAAQQFTDQLNQTVQGASLQSGFGVIAQAYIKDYAQIADAQYRVMAAQQSSIDLATQQKKIYDDMAAAQKQLSQAAPGSQQYEELIRRITADQQQLQVSGQAVAQSQIANVQAVRENTAAIQTYRDAIRTQLNPELNSATAFAGALSGKFGVDVTQAMNLASAAGVKWSDVIQGPQSKAFQMALLQVASLVAGYQAMGQQVGIVGNDMNVLSLTTSDQANAMQKLNQAWDAFTKALAAPVDTFLAWDTTMLAFKQDALATGAAMQGLGTDIISTSTKSVTASQVAASALTSTNQTIKSLGSNVVQVTTANAAAAQKVADTAKAAGASVKILGDQVIITGHNAQSAAQQVSQATPQISNAAIKLQQDFQSTFAATEQMFDAFRTTQALSQGNGSFVGFVRAAVASLIPLAGQNKAAAAEISALAQEAGGPATTSLQSLSKWAGNVKNPVLDMYNAMQQATIATSNLSLDAAKLAASLAEDVSALAKTSIETTLITPAMNALTKAIHDHGAGSVQAALASKNLNDILTNITGSSQEAQNVISLLTGAITGNARVAASQGVPAAKALSDALHNAHLPANALQGDINKIAAAQLLYGRGSPQYEAALKRATADVTSLGVGQSNAQKIIDDLAKRSLPASTKSLEDWAVKGLGFGEINAAALAGAVGKQLGPNLDNMGNLSLPKNKAKFIDWAANGLGLGISQAQTLYNEVVTLQKQLDNVKSPPPVSIKVNWDVQPPPAILSANGVTMQLVSQGPNGPVYKPVPHHATGGMIVDGTGPTADDVPIMASKGEFVIRAASVAKYGKRTMEAINSGEWGMSPWGRQKEGAYAGGGPVSVPAMHLMAFGGAVLPYATGGAVGMGGASPTASLGAADLATGTRQWNQLWQSAGDGFNKSVKGQTTQFLSRDVPSMLTTTGKAWADTWNKAQRDYSAQIEDPFHSFYQTTMPSYLGATGKNWLATWNKAQHDHTNQIAVPLHDFYQATMPSYLSATGQRWLATWTKGHSDFQGTVQAPIGTWFTGTLPATMLQGMRAGMNTTISDVINKTVGFINSDILKNLPGGLKVATVPGVASGGMPFYSVGGAGEHDSQLAMLMPGEYVLRKPARMALESQFGRGYVDKLNQADTWLGSGSRGTLASQAWPGMASGGAAWRMMATGMASGGACPPGANCHPGMASGGLVILPPGPPRGDAGVRGVGMFASGGQIASDAERYVGHRYVFGGPSNPTGGWDCSSFASYVLGHDLGLGIPGGSWASATGSGQSHGPTAAQYLAWSGATTVGNDPTAAQVGDLLSWPTHIGFLLRSGVMISAYDTAMGTLNTPETAGPSGETLTVRRINGSAPGGTGLGMGGTLGLAQSVGQAEGLINAAGTGLSPQGQALARFYPGGAPALMKIANSGAQGIWRAIWKNAIAAQAGAAPPDVIPGAVSSAGFGLLNSGVGSFMGQQDTKAKQATAAVVAGLGSISPVGGNTSGAQAYAQSLLPQYGWGPAQWPPLDALWNQESGWNDNAVNPSSGAYGIPQALPAVWGHPYPLGQFIPQIIWGLNYIRSRYGTPAAAEAHELSNHWYADGGPVDGPGGPTSDVVPIMASNGEWVINASSVNGLMRDFGPGIMDAINGYESGGSVPSGGSLGSSVAGGAFAGSSPGFGLSVPAASFAAGGPLIVVPGPVGRPFPPPAPAPAPALTWAQAVGNARTAQAAVTNMYNHLIRDKGVPAAVVKAMNAAQSTEASLFSALLSPTSVVPAQFSALTHDLGAVYAPLVAHTSWPSSARAHAASMRTDIAREIPVIQAMYNAWNRTYGHPQYPRQVAVLNYLKAMYAARQDTLAERARYNTLSGRYHGKPPGVLAKDQSVLQAAWNKVIGPAEGTPTTLTAAAFNAVIKDLKGYDSWLGSSTAAPIRHSFGTDVSGLRSSIRHYEGTMGSFESTWNKAYGPHGLANPASFPATPGPGRVYTGPSQFTMPGPNLPSPVGLPPSVYDFAPKMATGGPVGRRSGSALISSLASGLMPSMSARSFPSVVPVIGSDGASAGSGYGAQGGGVAAVSSPTTVTFGDINVYNPVAEQASTSIAHSTQKAAFLAGRELA